MKQQHAIWKSLEYPGLEYLYLLEEDATIQVVSTSICVIDQKPLKLDYVLSCDSQFVLKRVSINQFDIGGFNLTTDGHGNWLNQKLQPLPELDGCIDIDISATPFTNTLPIRRIQWQVGQSEVFKMAYIHIPDLTVSVDPQRYTCLEKTAHGATFRYESLDSDFTADITVDSDGLVLNYPGLFERIV